MSEAEELLRASEALAAAATEGRWSEATRQAWRRADLLDGVEDLDPETLRAALRAGEEARIAVAKLRAELEAELATLRASRRTAQSWRPYREASGGLLDVSS
ncbi:MAG: hypothetical protein R2748_32510 [Bryobacterales bacterium]